MYREASQSCCDITHRLLGCTQPTPNCAASSSNSLVPPYCSLMMQQTGQHPLHISSSRCRQMLLLLISMRLSCSCCRMQAQALHLPQFKPMTWAWGYRCCCCCCHYCVTAVLLLLLAALHCIGCTAWTWGYTAVPSCSQPAYSMQCKVLGPQSTLVVYVYSAAAQVVATEQPIVLLTAASTGLWVQ